MLAADNIVALEIAGRMLSAGSDRNEMGRHVLRLECMLDGVRPRIADHRRARLAAPLGALGLRDARLQLACLGFCSGVEAGPLNAPPGRIAQLLGKRHERVRVGARMRVVVVCNLQEK